MATHELRDAPKLCFTLMPMRGQLTELYEDVIKARISGVVRY